MTRLLAALALIALGSSSNAFASSPIRTAGNLGIGVGGGYWLDGLSLKYFMSDGMALQGVIGAWGYGHNDYYYGHDYYGTTYGEIGFTGDYLWEEPALADSNGLELAWNIGLGPSLAAGSGYVALGVHGTLGLEFNFKPIPLDLVFEYKPGFLILPGVDADLFDFAAHIRIYPF